MNEEELKLRIRNALEIIPDGHSFKVGELNFKLETNNNITVTGWTKSINLENLSKERALGELQEIKDLFDKMTSASPELSNFIKYKNVIFNLGFDYGKGGIGICTEHNGQLTWETELSNK